MDREVHGIIRLTTVPLTTVEFRAAENGTRLVLTEQGASVPLDRLAAGEDFKSPLARLIGSKRYHAEQFADGPYPVE
jgi:hypothetical protein